MAGTRTRRLALAATAALLLTGGVPLATAGTASAASGTASATGLSARWGSGATAVEVTAAEAAHPDGTTEADVPSAALGAAGSAEAVRARATGDAADGTVTSAASLDSLALDIGPARLLTGAVAASCTAVPGSAPRGTGTVADGTFTVRGLPPLGLPADPAPGTVVPLPGGLGQLVLNEQVRDADGTLTVTALRLTLSDAAEDHRGRLTAASARCTAGAAEPAELTARVEHDATDGPVAGVALVATALPPAGGDKDASPPPAEGDGDGEAPGTAAAGERDGAARPEPPAVSDPSAVLPSTPGAEADIEPPGPAQGKGAPDASDAPDTPDAAGTAGTTEASGTSEPAGPAEAAGAVGAADTTGALPAGECVTGPDGSCSLGRLDAGRYEVCVAAVPDGYALPEQPCRRLTTAPGSPATVGPFRVTGGGD